MCENLWPDFFLPLLFVGPVDAYIIRGRREVCYVVDMQKRARQIMSSIAYRNYGSLKEAPGLPEVTQQGVPLVFRRQAEEGEKEK